MTMTYYEIVEKLIGEIQPVGEPYVDDKRYENLKATIELVDRLMADIVDTAKYASDHRHSMKQAGIEAGKFLAELKEAIS